MAGDYGEPVFMLTKFMASRLLVCECEHHPGYYRLFKYKSTKRLADGVESQYYECRGCSIAIKENNANDRCARVTISGNRIRTNPNNGHFISCQQIPKNELEVKKTVQEARQKCRVEAKRPLPSYRETVNSIPRRYPNLADQQEIENLMPSYKAINRSLYRHVTHSILPIPDENNLPHPYTLTLRTREAWKVDPNSAAARERFLLFHNDVMVVFSSDLDLSVLHGSEFLIADGSFEMVPKDFAQLYTLHGFKNRECLPVCHALLRNKQRATYEQLFTVLRNATTQVFGNLGTLHTVLMDFEAAAHEAAQNVFQVETRGCTFHFGRCLQRWLQQHGLKFAYQNDIGGIKQWLGFIKSLALLPPENVLLVWNHWLRQPPRMDSRLNQQKLSAFVPYFENTWLYGTFPVQIWNHFLNVWRDPAYQGVLGPRTTNHAEGWHSKLNHDFGHPHPSLSSFLHWLQSTHHLTQVRIGQLAAGVEPARRDPRYARVDQDIANNKATFLQRRANILQNAPVHPNALLQEVEQYLRATAYLVGQYA